jgi:methylthioribose-1-phosphate isomerase
MPQTSAALQAPLIPRGPLSALPATLEWLGGADGVLRILDQTQLPARVEIRDCCTVEDTWEAIRTLRVRGAPAIGVAAAYGLCLGTRPFRALPSDEFLAKVREVGAYLRACRPTAVNLAWAVQRVTAAGELARTGGDAWEAMLLAVHALAVEDAETCRLIGEAGAHLVPAGGGVLTHCNAGALAAVAYGTALSLLYVAHQRGRRFRVFADETRPLLQGARLTVFELATAGLDVTLLCDGAAASLLQSGRIQLVVVGADRIAANGDTANKIGTYGVAIAARRHGVPFYVAAPLSTFDCALASGAGIPIEERGADEVRRVLGHPIAPPTVQSYNPAFDVTPAELITGIVTERGIATPVTTEQIAKLFQ